VSPTGDILPIAVLVLHQHINLLVKVKITLQGVIYHEITGSRNTLDIVRQMGDTGKAYTLIEGTGKIYGLVIINDLEEGKTFFFKDGAARKTEFTIKLTIVRDWQPSILGSIVGMGVGALSRIL
jgi:phage protein U